MKTSKLLLTGAIAVSLCLGLAYSLPVKASVTYTYTAPVTSWYDATGHNWQLYAGINSLLKFEFTVAAPLLNLSCGPNLCLTNITQQVQSWQYHGGSNFMNAGSSIGGTLAGLSLNTDANGNILRDTFYLSSPTVIAGLEAYQSSFTEAHDGYDQQSLFSSYSRFVTYDIFFTPIYGALSEGMSNNAGAGNWSMAINADVPPGSPIPEPDMWTLLLVGLAALSLGRARWQDRLESTEQK